MWDELNDTGPLSIPGYLAKKVLRLGRSDGEP